MDGAVMVLDVRFPRAPRVITSTVVAGSHLQPVCQVRDCYWRWGVPEVVGGDVLWCFRNVLRWSTVFWVV